MKNTFKDRLQYWFDNRMAAGTKGMAWMLMGAMTFMVCLMGGAAVVFGAREEGGILSALWDSLADMINAEMPEAGAGNVSSVVLTAVSAVIGLLFTSVLIGIVNNAIEEKLLKLRKGNSVVMEKDHTVILGFTPGEYELISQLILAADGRKTCLVIVENMDREEMEEAIRGSIEIPNSVRIVCRTADICDPNTLAVCSLATCKNIVLAPGKDDRTLKILLAVSSILGEAEKEKIRIVATVSKDGAMLPSNVAGKNGILMLQTYDMAARIIAHACTQPGLSEAFTDMFNFEGAELYLCRLPESEGNSFAQLMSRVDGGVPLGICRNGSITLNPNEKETISAEDTILFFTENKEKPHISEKKVPVPVPVDYMTEEPPAGTVLIIGFNEVLDTILQELPKNIQKIIVAGVTEQGTAAVEECMGLYPEKHISVSTEELQEDTLEMLALQADYVVLLSDHDLDEEAADIQSIRFLLRLRDIKTRLGLHFTITAEMRRESNRNLIAAGDPADFIVASNVSSMILAQLAENPMLYGVFQELLSNVGNELYLKSAAMWGLGEKQKSISELRMEALARGYILLGYLKEAEGKRKIVFNPPLEELVTFQSNDRLVVIGEQ